MSGTAATPRQTNGKGGGDGVRGGGGGGQRCQGSYDNGFQSSPGLSSLLQCIALQSALIMPLLLLLMLMLLMLEPKSVYTLYAVERTQRWMDGASRESCVACC